MGWREYSVSFPRADPVQEALANGLTWGWRVDADDPGRRAADRLRAEPTRGSRVNTLGTEIAAIIAHEGPISLERYMTLCCNTAARLLYDKGSVRRVGRFRHGAGDQPDVRRDARRLDRRGVDRRGPAADARLVELGPDAAC